MPDYLVQKTNALEVLTKTAENAKNVAKNLQIEADYQFAKKLQIEADYEAALELQGYYGSLSIIEASDAARIQNAEILAGELGISFDAAFRMC